MTKEYEKKVRREMIVEITVSEGRVNEEKFT